MDRMVASIVGALMAAGANAAEPPSSGFYGAMHGGGALRQNLDVTSGGATGTFEFDPGFSAGLAAGYRFASGFRLEADFTYSRDSFDQLQLLGVGVPLGGSITSYTGTVGLFYDFRLGSSWRPYLGAGAGVTRQKIANLTATVGATTINFGGSSGTDAAGFGELGLAYAVSSKVELVPSYRFLYVNDGGSGADDSMVHVARLSLRVFF
jgi:opacity protein-like surface antigen